ncbi:MAG: hypothetical protein Q4P13_03005 [Psychrobacter sp.]|nr:hypothetical protein [Psychrobacter sp.]
MSKSSCQFITNDNFGANHSFGKSTRDAINRRLRFLSLGLASIGIISCTPDVPDKTIAQTWDDNSNQAIVEVGQGPNASLDSAEQGSKFEVPNDTTGYQSKAVAKANSNIAKSYGHPKADDALMVEENLRNSYARLAAQRNDICPKLLQRDVDTNVIQRSNDIMIDNHCDYYIYPQPGQFIKAQSDNDQLKILLVAPVMHDFANGSFRVVTSQKHVIRVAYDGITHKPEAMRYSVSVILD